jgi:hypothetical protein
VAGASVIYIKLGKRRKTTPDDPISDDWFGYDETVSVEGLFRRNRGRWRIGARAERERCRYAAFASKGEVKFVAEIDGFELYDTASGTKRAIVGRVLDAKDPVAQRLVGTLVPDGSRSSVTYHPLDP